MAQIACRIGDRAQAAVCSGSDLEILPRGFGAEAGRFLAKAAAGPSGFNLGGMMFSRDDVKCVRPTRARCPGLAGCLSRRRGAWPSRPRVAATYSDRLVAQNGRR